MFYNSLINIILYISNLAHVIILQVILMSATIDASKFAKYFSTPMQGHLLPAPVISAGAASVHPIQTFYLNDLATLCKHKPVRHILVYLLPVQPKKHSHYKEI